MNAVDTNLVVRYLVADEPDQYARAVAVIEGSSIFLATSVLLETEWVLRSAYRFPLARRVAALRAVAGLATVTVEEAEQAWTALDWMEVGLDFADALHVARAADCDAFLTFDSEFIKRASGLGTVPVREP